MTKDWVFNASDELAARAGYRFAPERGLFVVDWIQENCRLYEGEHAGKAMMVRNWRLDLVMRLFSWVGWSDLWQREVRRFTEGDVFVAKKNGKSPTLAAIGLYLLCGDGEPGQKVYLCAKDGNQARTIAGEHTVRMVEKSPALREVCGINKSTYRVTHHPTASWMAPQSSSNERTQKSKEGLNGSVLVDELHVVDADYMNIIMGAGISRSEPLCPLGFSTAGSDPDAYGAMRFKKGAQIERGEIANEGTHGYFCVAYAAPQKLTWQELARDPVKWGKMANPAWGELIDPQEFMRSFAKAGEREKDRRTFMMYRLNIWQNATSPWLDPGEWNACRRELGE